MSQQEVITTQIKFMGSFKPYEQHMILAKASQPEILDVDLANTEVDNTKDHIFRIIEGYANRPTLDRVYDLVEPSAFKKSLPAYMKNPLIRYNHQTGEIVGKVLDAEIRKDGLWIKAQIFRNTEISEKVWSLIIQGGLQSFSVYGIIKEKSVEQALDGKRIQRVTEFDLHEIAIVDIPANQDSLFTIIKKSVDVPMSETVEKTNPDATLSFDSGEQNVTAPNTETKEVGNEAISSESTVLDRITEVLNFQQKQLEVMVTFAETQNEIIQKLMSIETNTVDQGMGDDFEDEDFADEEDSAPEDAKSLESEKSGVDVIMKRLEVIEKQNTVTQKDLEDKIAKLTKENKTLTEKTEIKEDVDVEEAVSKAVKEAPQSVEDTEEAVAKTYENAGDRMFDYMSQKISN